MGTRKHELARDLSTADSTVQVGLPRRAAESGENPAFEQGASLTALLRPPIENDQFQTAFFSHHNGIANASLQPHLSRIDNLYASQAIREPPRSEQMAG